MIRAILFLLVFIFGAQSVSAAGPCRRIGVTLPLTSSLVAAGENFRKGILLASEHLDPRGEVEFIFEDDQFRPVNTITAVRRLIAGENVCALLIFGTPTGIAAAPVAEEAGIPAIIFSLFTPVMEGRSCVIKHFVSVERENQLIREEALRRKYKRTAVVSSIHDAMLRLKELYMMAPGVVFSDELPLQQDDFRTVVSRVLQSRPDSVYVLLFKHQALFIKQLRRGGFTGEIFAAHNIEDPYELTAGEGLMESVWYANADDKAAGDWYMAWEKRFGDRPVLGGMNGYDMAKLMIEGSRASDLNAYLHEVKHFRGAFAKYGFIEKRGFEVPVTLKVIRNGRFEHL